MKASKPGPAERRHDEQFRSYGNTVILTLTVDTAAGPLRETHVWIKDGGQWRNAAVHMSLVPKK
jgi:hypothetical protein